MVSPELILKIAERLINMFMQGDKLWEIKSMCLVDYANYLHNKKKLEGAAKYYNKALSYNADNYYANAGLSAILTEKRLFGQALEYFNKAFSIKKPDIVSLFLLAVIYESLGEDVLFKEVLQKTFKFFDSNRAAAFNRLSYTYLRLGRYKEAEYHIKEAIEICPAEGGLRNNLAKILLAQKKLSEAKKEFERVLELSSDKRLKKFATKNIRNMKHIKGEI